MEVVEAWAPVELHPVVGTWFARRFPEGPTDAQAKGWPLVRQGTDVLIAAPTGSGKTLAGFLIAIDDAYRAQLAGEYNDGTRVVYVSPLKALAIDVHQNLVQPLSEITQVAVELGFPAPGITVAVRTGDTPPAARAAMLKGPPTFLVTTPESLYLYLTAERSRTTLTRVKTVIVDEVHALARDKRGSHLALSLERLQHVQTDGRVQRLGLSATQEPVQATARLLSGAQDRGESTDGVQIVDCGHSRELRVSVQLPETELAAVLSQEQLADVVKMIAALVKDHQTTLVFVNTRRLSERLAHVLGELLGPDQVAAHHGSLSADRRKTTETRLRAGDLRALVATASLELGIDIGPVELVCQVGSPRSIATFLQRVGRANHSRHGVPEGVLFPTTRDELVECAALLAAVRKGRLDAVLPPVAPLDILAQQVVAEVAAAGEWEEDALFQLVRRAAPYDGLPREDFDAVVELASEGIPTGRGARMAYLHRDGVNGVLRPRRGARLAALTSGGAIPEVGDYRVVAEPDDTFVGSVNEDFAIESMAGDVFLLGTHAWRIRRVTSGEVRVTDAEGARPTVPFWLGEAPSRTAELSEEVSELRRLVAQALVGTGTDGALDLLVRSCGLDAVAAMQVVAYLSTGLGELGVLPTQQDIVYERFFDGSGGMQLVVHSPFGGRVNRALGLALRKRFCVTFDFELQAAANDDAAILSLGPQHSFPLASVPRLLHPNTVRATLEQAVLASPMFVSRWRWDLNRALAVLRFRGGKKNPLPLQRMEADDLMAAVFPALAACQENTAPGPVPIPEHTLVRQALHDCLHEAMDVDGLAELVARLHSGEVRAHFVDSVQPSVLSHEIVNSGPYTFLDNAPLEERRSRQVQLRRGLPVEARDLSNLSQAALERLRAEVAPALRSAEELHDLLLSVVVHRPRPEWQGWHEQLAAAGRAMTVELGTAETGTGEGVEDGSVWCATERRHWVSALFPGASFVPDHRLPTSVPLGEAAPDPDHAAAQAVRGHLLLAGPVTVEVLAGQLALAPSRVLVGLALLEAEGFAMRGDFDRAIGHRGQWCARHLLARAHSYTQARLRSAVQPLSAQDFMRFLFRWQHVVPGTRRQGHAGLVSVIEQLQGFQLAAGAWEEHVLPARVEGYQRRWLEDLCLSGTVTWGRLSLRPPELDGQARRGASTPSRATPVTFALRDDMPWLMPAARGPAIPEEPAHGASREVLDALRSRGAMFASELPALTGRLPGEVEEGLWDLVARGIVTADGFAAVRSLFSRHQVWARQHPADRQSRLGPRALGRRAATVARGGEGRWALLPQLADDGRQAPLDELAEQLAGQLLARWGVVMWELAAREAFAVPWRELLWALRRLEARGQVRGGRFVTGFAGEQYALPEAFDELRRVRLSQRRDEVVRLSATDPLNLSGVVLAGRRVPALRTNSVTFRDGLLVAAGEGGPVVPSRQAG
jgi:ATP-dependent Lhr-like helicase